MTVAVVKFGAFIHKLLPKLGVVHGIVRTGKRGKVCEQHAEGYAYEQQRLKLLFNAEVQKEQRNKNHRKRSPVLLQIAEQHIKACCFGKINYFIHMSILPTVNR